MPTDHNDPLTLDTIARWLDDDPAPSPERARAMFEQVIPLALDLEVAKLHDRSLILLRKAMEVAGLPEDEIKAKLSGEPSDPLPASCVDCSCSAPQYDNGDYLLLCRPQTDSDERSTHPPIARVGRAEAFYMPAQKAVETLDEAASGLPIPDWCPLKVKHA